MRVSRDNHFPFHYLYLTWDIPHDFENHIFKKDTDKLEKVQRRVIKIVMGSGPMRNG